MAVHSLADHVKHLRMTNLTPLIVCVGILIVLSDPYLIRVQRDLNHIETIRQHLYKFDDKAFKDNQIKSIGGPFLLTSQLAGVLPIKPSIRLMDEQSVFVEPYTRVVIKGIEGSFRVMLDLPFAVVVHNDMEYSEITKGLGPDFGIEVSSESVVLWKESRTTPKTTEGFKGFWNILNDLEVYLAEEEERSFAVYRILSNDTNKAGKSHDTIIVNLVGPDNRFGFEKLDLQLSKKRRFARPVRLHGAPIRKGFLESRYEWNRVARSYFAVVRVNGTGGVKQVSEWKKRNTPLVDAQPGDYLFVRNIRFNRSVLRLQERLLAAAFADRPEVKSIQVGHFKDSFPDLNRYLAGLGEGPPDVSFDSLSIFVDRDLARGNTPIEVMGIKIQAGEISFWGLIILIGVQLYFAIHFSAFTSELKTNRDIPRVPWIGVYGGLIPSLMLLAGVVVLPAYTAGTIAYSAVIYRDGNWWYWALGGVSFILAVATLVSIVLFLKDAKSKEQQKNLKTSVSYLREKGSDSF